MPPPATRLREATLALSEIAADSEVDRAMAALFAIDAAERGFEGLLTRHHQPP
jgi:hypothetical protein